MKQTKNDANIGNLMEPCNQNKNEHKGEDDGAERAARVELLNGKRMERLRKKYAILFIYGINKEGKLYRKTNCSKKESTTS